VKEEWGKTLDDILWFGTREYKITTDLAQFLDFEYNNGFGDQVVAKDLNLVGEGFWLERHEYDGSERWEYKTIPKTPSETRGYLKANLGCWNTLEEINTKEEFE